MNNIIKYLDEGEEFVILTMEMSDYLTRILPIEHLFSHDKKVGVKESHEGDEKFSELYRQYSKAKTALEEYKFKKRYDH